MARQCFKKNKKLRIENGGKMKQIKTSWALIMVFAAAVIIGGVLAWAFGWVLPDMDLDFQSPITVGKKTNSNANTNSDIKDETADWETYTNNKCYYSLKYPKDWMYTVGGEDNNLISFMPKGYDQFLKNTVDAVPPLSVFCADSQTHSLDEFLYHIENKQETTLDNIKAYSGTFLMGETKLFKLIASHNNDIYIISCDKDNESKIPQKILSTFRFTQ